MRVLPRGVDAPVKATKTLGAGGQALTSAWAFVPSASCDKASAKGGPAGDLVEYAVTVDGEGAIYICEGDVTALDPAPIGIKVTAGYPFNGTCRAAGISGLSLRSVPDAVSGQLVIGTSSFTA